MMSPVSGDARVGCCNSCCFCAFGHDLTFSTIAGNENKPKKTPPPLVVSHSFNIKQ